MLVSAEEALAELVKGEAEMQSGNPLARRQMLTEGGHEPSCGAPNL